MARKGEVASLEASHGQKMIEVKLRFWTNGIAKKKGQVLPKHAWSSGVVRMERNEPHGITPSGPKVFHSLLDVGSVIEKVLIEHGIVLHASARMKKYIAE
jgi:hypothetical protein